MTMRRCWLVVCSVLVGVVAGVGCGGRELDPGGEPSGGGSGAPPGGGTTAVTPGVTPGSVDTWIAFDSDGGGTNRDIYVIRADGTGRRRLTTASSVEAQPSFSRDGTKLAFASDQDG